MITREQFEAWARLCSGTTIRELRHVRKVPRASLSLYRPARIPRAARLPLNELEGTASKAYART